MSSEYHRLSPLSSRPNSPAYEEEGGALLETSTRPDAYRTRRIAARRCSTVSLVTLGALFTIPFLLYTGSVVGERRAESSAATAAALTAAPYGLVPAPALEEGQSPSLDELREIVDGSRGYYARDWPLHLGAQPRSLASTSHGADGFVLAFLLFSLALLQVSTTFDTLSKRRCITPSCSIGRSSYRHTFGLEAASRIDQPVTLSLLLRGTRTNCSAVSSGPNSLRNSR